MQWFIFDFGAVEVKVVYNDSNINLVLLSYSKKPCGRRPLPGEFLKKPVYYVGPIIIT